MWGIEGFVVGVVTASAVWLAVLRVVLLRGRRTQGALAQDLTRDLVDVVPQWLAVHDLPLGGRTLDHVVITPLAVLAIETSWWGEASPAVHEQRREAATTQAAKNARALKHLLASRDLGFELPVWPVVVAWGPGAEPTTLGRVDVVAGEAAGSWIAAYQTGAINGRLATAAHAALVAYRSRLDERERHRVAA